MHLHKTRQIGVLADSLLYTALGFSSPKVKLPAIPSGLQGTEHGFSSDKHSFGQNTRVPALALSEQITSPITSHCFLIQSFIDCQPAPPKP